MKSGTPGDGDRVGTGQHVNAYAFFKSLIGPDTFADSRAPVDTIINTQVRRSAKSS